MPTPHPRANVGEFREMNDKPSILSLPSLRTDGSQSPSTYSLRERNVSRRSSLPLGYMSKFPPAQNIPHKSSLYGLPVREPVNTPLCENTSTDDLEDVILGIVENQQAMAECSRVRWNKLFRDVAGISFIIESQHSAINSRLAVADILAENTASLLAKCIQRETMNTRGRQFKAEDSLGDMVCKLFLESETLKRENLLLKQFAH